MIKNFNSFINENRANGAFLFVKLAGAFEVSDVEIKKLLETFDHLNMYLKCSTISGDVEGRVITDIVICLEGKEQESYILKDISERLKIDIEEYKTIPLTNCELLAEYMMSLS